MGLLMVFALAIGTLSFAEDSPLCTELARYSCSPGSSDDGTGVARSQSEIEEQLSSFTTKSKSKLRKKFQTLLRNPDNTYFRDIALAAFGLKNSPQCISEEETDLRTCEDNLIEGLIQVAQLRTLSGLLPASSITLQRGFNLRELDYVVQNQAYLDIEESVREDVQTHLSSPELATRIETDIFPKVKALMIGRLRELNIPEDKRRLMINKVNSITFQGTSCEALGSSQSETSTISAYITPNAFYDPNRNTFNFCSGLLLQSSSEFQIAAIIAHELSHSIDPCAISHAPADLGFHYSDNNSLSTIESEYPLGNVIQCLRRPESVGAVNVPDEMLRLAEEAAARGGVATGGGMGFPRTPTTPAQQWTPPPGATNSVPKICINDQVTEAFCDWMAMEILPDYISENHELTQQQYLTGYGNAFKSLCRITSEEGPGLSTHPSSENRINRVILTHPEIRAQMGCSAQHPEFIYCDASRPYVPPSENITSEEEPDVQVPNPVPPPPPNTPSEVSR